MSDKPILSRDVSSIELPASPVNIVAGERERVAIAAANGLLSVDNLAATVELSRVPGGAIAVSGHLTADIVQACVVSLDPVPAHIDETFTVRYVRGQRGAPTGEIVVDPGAPDPPDVLEGPNIDVGALVEEHFILAIDPYPRAPGAALPAAADIDEPDDTTSPFAALAAFARKNKGFDPK